MVVSVTLNELQSGLKASKFTAVLDTKDNKYKLDVSCINLMVLTYNIKKKI